MADIGNARLSIRDPDTKAAPTSRLTIDHIAVRRAPAPEDATRFAVVFPREVVWLGANGGETRLILKDAAAHAIVDTHSNRARETSLGFAGVRLDDKKTGDWIAFGPLSFSSKLSGAADGGWTTPIDFELKGAEFFVAGVPLGGTIGRIGYSARTAGPDLSALNRLRDRIDALRQSGHSPPAAQLDALLDMLPDLPSRFSLAQGEFTVEGVAIRTPDNEPLAALATVSIGGALTGLSGDDTALRITLKHDGLTLAPTVLDKAKVVQRGVMDFGLDNLATAPLRGILEAAKTMREGTSEADTARATQQMLGAAAMLNPVFRIYDLSLDTPGVGVAATAEARGSPLSPKGYSAEGEITVRGFDTLPGLIGDAWLASYLPVLQKIGTNTAVPDGTPRLAFRLHSAPPKWITVNGNDVAAWFIGGNASPGQPRALRPHDPALTGADVRAVQKALADAKLAVPQTGAYGGATAVAIARFQKQNGLNIDGVVDAATRRKLGVKPEPPAAQPLGPHGSQPSRPG